eukprot:523115_1
MSFKTIKETIDKWIKQSPKTSKTLKFAALICGILCCRQVYIKTARRIRNHPPGPAGIPFFGCFLSVGIYPFYFFTHIAEKYGDIVSVPLFWNNSIYINNANLVHQIFKDSKLNNHFISHNSLRKVGAFDLVNGPEWKKRRRFVQTSLLKLTNQSFVLDNMEKSFNNHLIKLFEKNQNQNNTKNFLWYPRKSISFNSLNMIFSAIFGVQLKYTDKFAKEYVDAIIKRFRSATFVLLIDVSLGVKLPEWLMWKVLSSHRDNENQIDNILTNWMNKNGFMVDLKKSVHVFKRNYNYNNSNKSESLYIDICIDALNKNVISPQEMMSDIQALIGNTIDTSTTTIEYAVLLLAKHPNIQQQIFTEICAVMEKHNLSKFNFEILNELHVFRAFVYETLRISCAVPSGVGHTLFEDMNIELPNGTKMLLSKDSVVHYNVYYIMKKKLWKEEKQNSDVYNFENNEIHLEYWIDAKNGKFKKNDNFVGFGSGKRDCPGQPLAIKAIYAFLALLITKYELIAQNNDPNSINIQQAWGMIMTIKTPIPVIVQKRT